MIGHDGINLDSDSLVESGVIDSLGIMKLVEFIERTFEIKVDDTDLVPEHFDTLDAMNNFLSTKGIS